MLFHNSHVLKDHGLPRCLPFFLPDEIEINDDLLNLGIIGNLKACIPLPFFPSLVISADTTYTFQFVNAATSLSMISIAAGVEYNKEISPRWTIIGAGHGGGYYGFFNEELTNFDGEVYKNQQEGVFLYDGYSQLPPHYPPLTISKSFIPSCLKKVFNSSIAPLITLASSSEQYIIRIKFSSGQI